MADEFGDFDEVKNEDPSAKPGPDQPEFSSRLRMPRLPELLGVVVQRLGGNRMDVRTTDGKSRNCRVPGRFRRRFWLRPGDPIIIVPWEMDDSKGDIIFQYRKPQVTQLRKKGLLDGLRDEF